MAHNCYSVDVTGRKNPETFSRSYPSDGGVTVTATYAVGDDRLVRVVCLTFEGEELDSRHLRQFPLARALAEGQEQAWQASPILQRWPDHVPRPDGTDEWYRTFAALFIYAKTRHPEGPAKWVAADLAVPVATVHRWTRETRRRGHLPPDPRGRRSK